MKKILIILLVFAGITAYSQCTNVCIQGVPTFSCSNCGGGGGTSTVTVSNPSYTATTTYTLIPSGSPIGTIPAGCLSISVLNIGTSDLAIFNGAPIYPGQTINISLLPNAILPSYTYDVLTTTLLILYNR